jgi:hypothetical protein
LEGRAANASTPVPEDKWFTPGIATVERRVWLVKDLRGKDATQVVWKFDSALEAKIFEALKQAAIEEGQWTEILEIRLNRMLALSAARSQRRKKLGAMGPQTLTTVRANMDGASKLLQGPRR